MEYNQPIHTILADNEFKMLQEQVKGCEIRVNINTKEEHVWRDKIG
jgi:hypothetical protein